MLDLRTTRRIFATLILLAGTALAQAPTTKHYGTSCGGTFLSVSLPKLGTMLNFSVQNDDASMVFVGIGATSADTSISPGCQLLVTPAWVGTFPSSKGVASGDLGLIPSDPTWLGVSFFVQAVSNDTRGAAWTRGIEAVIGR